jgi:hypothetical protein
MPQAIFKSAIPATTVIDLPKRKKQTNQNFGALPGPSNQQECPIAKDVICVVQLTKQEVHFTWRAIVLYMDG